MTSSDVDIQPTLILYDDATARRFEPFAFSRPLGEMRAGAPLIRERWEQVLGVRASGFLSRPELVAFAEFDAPPPARGDAHHSLPAGAVIVNTRALPALAGAIDVRRDSAVRAWSIAGRVAAVRLTAPLSLSQLDRGEWWPPSQQSRDGAANHDTDPDASHVSLDGLWLDEVWDLVRHLNALLLADIPSMADALRCRALLQDTGSNIAVTGPHPVWLEDGAHVEPMTVFDTTLGPVLLREGATVQAFTRVTGPCFVGKHSTLSADRISGSSIGDVCRVHGELSASILTGHSNKGHDGFVGHSVFGRWVNLGASTVTSNLKNTYGTVALWTPDGIRDSGLQFLGTFFGDHAKTGIGLRLTTGCVLGAGANVMDAMPPKHVAPFSWGTGAPYANFAFDKFVETATRMMARRGVTFDATQERMWRGLHEQATQVDVRAAESARKDRSDASRHGSR
ncbi:MAG TPA: putative sugar nucleotidyl transferase [Gemmatimonas sp.]|nr:putative sugar nucleotidyl transferase [Gemmatimonas sp.]